MLYNNCCDGIYNSFDIHFTKICENKCPFCINKDTVSFNNGKPDWKKIFKTVVENQTKIDNVLILGGEPCLFLDDLYHLVKRIKKWTHLKVYLTTSVPRTCFENQKLFFKIIDFLDGMNISALHYDEFIANCIRNTVPMDYFRQPFYKSLPHKEKIRINLNLVKNYFETPKQILYGIRHYDRMKFAGIKLNELQHSPDWYVSFEKVFNVKLPSPYYHGCQKEIDLSKYIKNFDDITTPVILKRSCFLVEDTLNASLLDGVKILSKKIIKNKKNNFGVIYEDGRLENGWITSTS